MALIAVVHPALLSWIERVPLPVSLAVGALTAADLLVSAAWVRHTGGRECLAWYRGKKKASSEGNSEEAE